MNNASKPAALATNELQLNLGHSNDGQQQRGPKAFSPRSKNAAVSQHVSRSGNYQAQPTPTALKAQQASKNGPSS